MIYVIIVDSANQRKNGAAAAVEQGVEVRINMCNTPPYRTPNGDLLLVGNDDVRQHLPTTYRSELTRLDLTPIRVQ